MADTLPAAKGEFETVVPNVPRDIDDTNPTILPSPIPKGDGNCTHNFEDTVPAVLADTSATTQNSSADIEKEDQQYHPAERNEKPSPGVRPIDDSDSELSSSSETEDMDLIQAKTERPKTPPKIATNPKKDKARLTIDTKARNRIPGSAQSPRNRPGSPLSPSGPLKRCAHHQENPFVGYNPQYRCMICGRCKLKLGLAEISSKETAVTQSVSLNDRDKTTIKKIRNNTKKLLEQYQRRLEEISNELSIYQEKESMLDKALVALENARSKCQKILEKLQETVALESIKAMVANVQTDMSIDIAVESEKDHLRSHTAGLRILQTRVKTIVKMMEQKLSQLEIILGMPSGSVQDVAVRSVINFFMNEDKMETPVPEPPQIPQFKEIEIPSMMELLIAARGAVTESERARNQIEKVSKFHSAQEILETEGYRVMNTISRRTIEITKTVPVPVAITPQDRKFHIPVTIDEMESFSGADTLKEVVTLYKMELHRSGPLQYSDPVPLEGLDLEPVKGVVAALSPQGLLSYYGENSNKEKTLYLVDLTSRTSAKIGLSFGPCSLGFDKDHLIVLPLNGEVGFSSRVKDLMKVPSIENLGDGVSISRCTSVQVDELTQYTGYFVYGGDGQKSGLLAFGKGGKVSPVLSSRPVSSWRSVPTGVVGQTQSQRLCVDSDGVKLINLGSKVEKIIYPKECEPTILLPSTTAPGDLSQGVLVLDGIWLDLRTKKILDLTPLVMPAKYHAIVRVYHDVFLIYDICTEKWMFIRLRVD